MVQQQDKSYEFKLSILGDKGVGKTSFTNCFFQSMNELRYDQNNGQDMKIVQSNQENTKITFKLLEVLSMNDIEKSKQINDKESAAPNNEYTLDIALTGSDCAIIMFDVTDRITYKNIPNYYKNLIRVCENIPIILIGNKIDNQERKVKSKSVTFHRKKNLMYYEISTKYNHNVTKPFELLAKKLTGDNKIQIQLNPPQLQIDEKLQKLFIEYENQLQETISYQLVDEEL